MKEGIPAWEDRVYQWAFDRNILDGSTPLKQFDKLLEEVGELRENLRRLQDSPGSGALTLLNAIADDVGDCCVVLRIIAAQCGLNWDTCLEKAWDDIKYRNGKLINGVFVKESDL